MNAIARSLRISGLGLGLLTLAASVAVADAHAAQDYANCTGFIDSIPATISAPGTWCLRGHKYTSQTTGAAITIAADNVTVDCNHFRVSGLGALSESTMAVGVYSGSGRQGATVRQCRIQGFRYGVQLSGDRHVVENNAIDRSFYIGVFVEGDGAVIRGNAINQTGGPSPSAYGVYALSPATALGAPQILDNAISAVRDRAAGTLHLDRGILTNGLAEGNHLHHIGDFRAGDGIGIKLIGGGVANDNVITGGGHYGDRQHDVLPDIAILGAGIASSVCRNNVVVGYGDVTATYIRECRASGLNLVKAERPYPDPAGCPYPRCGGY